MCGVTLLLLLIALILGIWLTVSLIGLIVTLVIAGLVGWLAYKVVPARLPYGWLGAIVAGLLGSWIGGVLLGDLGPEIGGITLLPALVGSLILAFFTNAVSKSATS
jgi:uncharacterized membrane protein YeaQ/YmgE (transglycosylase-associated protein family)